MPHRDRLPTADRHARSRLIKLLADAAPLARASLVSMARTCGKKSCKCAQGDKHVSLYLAARVGKQRKMIYVPPELEDLARTLVHNIQQADQLLEQMSQASLERFNQTKSKRKGRSRS